MMIVLAKIALGTVGVVVAGVGVLCSEGVVNVKVAEKQPNGFHFHVIAPALLAPIAVRVAPRSALAQAARQIQPNLPAIQAVLDGLSDSEDVVLVEVRGPDEHVEVQKVGGSIIVDVDDPNDTVHVSAPIRAIASTVNQLAAAGADSSWRQAATFEQE
jgi:hypothetical protein